MWGPTRSMAYKERIVETVLRTVCMLEEAFVVQRMWHAHKLQFTRWLLIDCGTAQRSNLFAIQFNAFAGSHVRI